MQIRKHTDVQCYKEFQAFNSIQNLSHLLVEDNKILCCNHPNKTSLAVFLHGTICFLIFYKVKFRISLEF